MSKENKLWIGTNWKMNKTLTESLDYAAKLKELSSSINPRIQKYIIPSYTSMRQVKDALKDSDIMVGAQNMHWKDTGAWTGEISPLMLKDCGMDMVVIGHSERREHFHETDEAVALKTDAAVKNGLIALICIGETLNDRKNGNATVLLERQMRSALKYLDKDSSAPIVIAYEPVWSIGENGIPATTDYAESRQAEIKVFAKKLLGREIPCLYGGSVSPSNCADFVNCPNIDGLFIGRSAWEPKIFIDMLNICSQAIS